MIWEKNSEHCLSVVMPLYNESASVRHILEEVLLQPSVAEVIVVDDSSTDGSPEIIHQMGIADARIKLTRHERNKGKGASLRTGILQATADMVLI